MAQSNQQSHLEQAREVYDAVVDSALAVYRQEVREAKEKYDQAMRKARTTFSSGLDASWGKVQAARQSASDAFREVLERTRTNDNAEQPKDGASE